MSAPVLVWSLFTGSLKNIWLFRKRGVWAHESHLSLDRHRRIPTNWQNHRDGREG